MNEQTQGTTVTSQGTTETSYSSSHSSSSISFGHQPMAAPEIDPASSIAAITLLVGAVLVMNGRKALRSSN